MSNTEKVVNIVWTLEDPNDEGFCTNSVFRVFNKEHEEALLEKSEFIIESTTAIATPLTCRLDDEIGYEFGCYSAG